MTEQFRRMEDSIVQLCETKHEDLDRRLISLEEAVKNLVNRPPVWATFIMTGMGTVIGALLGHISSHIK